MKLNRVKIDEIKEYEKNPRLNDDAVDYVLKSIEKYGYLNPILVDKNNVIISGHTRYKAFKKMGLKEIDVVRIEDLNDKQVKAFRIADNKVAEISNWDNLKLVDELKNIEENIRNELKEFNFEYNKVEDLEINEEEFISDKKVNKKHIICPYCGEEIE
jgi:ParB-like chromosome segregation protein Spo0J